MQKAQRYILLLVGIIFIAFAYWPSEHRNRSSKVDFQEFQEVLFAKEKQLDKRLKELHFVFQQDAFIRNTAQFEKDWEGEGFSYFVFINDKLKYWSEDITSLENEELLANESGMKNGAAWQEKRKYQSNDTTYVGLISIQSNYPYQNQFLQNSFRESFSFPLIETTTDFDKGTWNIYTKEGLPLFGLIAKTENQPSSNLSFAVGVFAGIGLLLILHYLPLIIVKRRKTKVIFAIFLAILIRILIFYFPPYAWANWGVFQPSEMAISRWIPSLGDFFLHASLILYAAILLPLVVRDNKRIFVHFCVVLLGFLLSAFLVNVIQSAVFNSSISFNLNRIFQLTIYSYLSFITFALLVFATISLLYHGSKKLFALCSLQKHFILALSAAIAATAIAAFYFKFSYVLFWGLIPYILFLIHHNRPSRRSLSLPIFVLLSASLLTAYAIYKVAFVKEAKNRELIVVKLAEEKDPVAEYLFEELQDSLRSDKHLKVLLKHYWEVEKTAENYLFSNYFNGYWEKYKIIFTPCKVEDSLYVNPESAAISCKFYFQNRIRREGKKVSSTNMFQLRNFPGRIAYLAEVSIPVDSTNYTLYIEFVANNFNENEGYPELLIETQSQFEDLRLNEYAYAVYEKEELVYHFGNFNYERKLKVTEISPSSFFLTQWENHEHLLYQKDKSTTIVLSRPLPKAVNFFTYWAYLFVIYAVLFLVLAGFVGGFPFHYRFPFTDFSVKVQLLLIGSLLMTLLFFSLGTTYYIQKQYGEKNAKILSEKVRSINLELEQKFGGEEFLAAEMQSYIANSLIKISNVFYSDINIYNTNGELYATSRPEVFDKGLKSKRLNPKAYHALVKKDKAEWVQKEQIGEMAYLSAYIPFKNYNNEILAYLNLPYFSKQGELEQEISSFLVSTVNIYVGIFTLSLLVSVLLINQLSRPLLMIRNQISRLKLGSSVELIAWDSNDEIGALVKEYNRIAIELSESAEQLAQSEREDAWREMAKQVAHEIKNPLTPMRLHVQHLQRMEITSAEEMKKRMERTAQNLIEQIDSLTKIANAFSTFAKLPEKKFERLDVLPILQSAVSIYEDEVNIQLLSFQEKTPAFIMGDKGQLLRLFNNLIKNATQAIETVEGGEIIVKLTEKEAAFELEIKDNGVGMEEKDQDRIFEPNFTTKTSGTGLGLAMSKSIVEQMDGSIYFTSTIGEGTTFYLEFKKA